MKKPFELIAATPAGFHDPAIAIAASRAGALGILDLEYIQEEQVAIKAIAKLAQYAKRPCGIKLDSQESSFIKSVIPPLPDLIEYAILTPADTESLRDLLQTLNDFDLKIYLEVTCLDQALTAVKLGAHGVIAKGSEAGGRVNEETSFILLQRVLSETSLPVWAQGGIGLHTVGACYVAGAAGAVLDSQLLLTSESTVSEKIKAMISSMDGSETICVGVDLGESYRIFSRPDLPIVQKVTEKSQKISRSKKPRSERLKSWRREIKDVAGWENPHQNLLLMGQDAAFAKFLSERYHTVGGVISAFRQAIESHVQSARNLQPLSANSALAQSHQTRYPIVQGPMTRVSDTAVFAEKIAEGGGLPMLALAMMRAREVRKLLDETRSLLGFRSWGVGILGFVPLDLRQEQLEVLREYRPPFAIIAGGRPDQARTLEKDGIATYLHVPSPGLLKMFLENGAHRFIFEGRECGGHVGPRSSFVLWNTMVDILLESLSTDDLQKCHVLFAGGIHDALSSSMVATIAAPLAERGAKIGALLGTSYLFTKEATTTGAIVKEFQNKAIQCTQTVLLESGPGHATRCADSPYVKKFNQQKRQLSGKKLSAEAVRLKLEELNLGRLRIASKGAKRNAKYTSDGAGPKLVSVDEKAQRSQGMYMIGQLAALKNQTCTIAELHHEVAVKGSERLAKLTVAKSNRVSIKRKEKPSDVAIIGMSCLLPKANDLQTYWENILNKVDAITEVPEDRWDWQLYFDPDPKARDKVYSKWGGFIDPVPFDPMAYGMPPNTLPSIEPLQLLTLEVVRQALQDAGYADRPFVRASTSVIIGVGGGAGDLGQQYALRSGLPMFIENPSTDVWERLPEWTEDSFAGILANVAAGRVANRFNFGGVNYTVDAACASSLAAIYLATRELENGTSDMVIVGGADTVQNPFGYLCFSKTHALSPRGRCRTFDQSADGIVISEGFAMLVLKRLADAEKDGDRIYGVIKAVAGSSDGRDKGLTAPRPEGQARALNRAYHKAHFSPNTVELIEAHGTGTVVGDKAEVETLKQVFESAGASGTSCAIGSVKSMIGHTKCTAGVAGLMKITKALYHKVLPPTSNVDKPNATLQESPFYVNTEARPWIHASSEHLRRAGVSAFGFGGTNFHAVVEEYQGDFLEKNKAAVNKWPCELLIWKGNSRQDLVNQVESLQQSFSQGARPRLRDLAYSLWKNAAQDSELTVAIVATTIDDLHEKLHSAKDALIKVEQNQVDDPRGIYFFEKPLGKEGKIACLFPGQGSQYVDMLSEMAIHFREVREAFEAADQVLLEQLAQPLSAYVYPPSRFSPEETHSRQQALTQTNIAQPALGAASVGLFNLLQNLGINPDMTAGHSYGEYVALWAANVFDDKTLYRLSEARGRCILDSSKDKDLGAMAAVHAGPEATAEVIATINDVWIANHNAPNQTIISGTQAGIGNAIKAFAEANIQASLIDVACAFHSPIIAAARDSLAKLLSTIPFNKPGLQVFFFFFFGSHAPRTEEIVSVLWEHLVRPFEFVAEIEAMYDSGARVFVEVGPRNILTSLTRKILDKRLAVVVALDVPARPPLLQLHHALGLLAGHGVILQLDRLYGGRDVRKLNLKNLVHETAQKQLSPTTWMVDCGKARPLNPIQKPTKPSKTADHNMATEPEKTPQEQYSKKPQQSDSLKDKAVSLESQQEVPNLSVDLAQADDDITRVFLRHQQLMSRFLQTHQQVMLAYLTGSPSGEGLPLETPIAASETTKSQTAPAPPTESPREAEPDTLQETNPEKDQDKQAEIDITKELLQIVSDRTGYPTEILGLDLDMEADLGIDSIKRVEILGALQQICFSEEQDRAQEAMEELTKIKTLRGIIDWFREAGDTESGQNITDSTNKKKEEAERPAPTEQCNGQSEQLTRFLLKAVEAPRPAAPQHIIADALFIITDDGQGIARKLAEKLENHGALAVLVRIGDEVGELTKGIFTADLTDETSVTELLSLIRKQYKRHISGIFHLLSLRNHKTLENTNFQTWQSRFDTEVKSLFHLAKAAHVDLTRAADEQKSWVVTATPNSPEYFPERGAIAGFVKTMALEWPSIQCKVVNFDVPIKPSDLTASILQELTSDDKEVEIAYKDGARQVLKPYVAPLNSGHSSGLQIDSDSVIVITGGGRGITAEISCELAERFKPTIVLIGKSPLPEKDEPAETAQLKTAKELKTAILNQKRQNGESVTPKQVDAECEQVLRMRELKSNLAAMKTAGANVEYLQVDVSDPQAFGSTIDKIYQTHGRVDGFIHGAGTLEDKLILDKTSDSFDRVFRTKADSAFTMAKKLRPKSLRFLVFFSSIAGRFGNRGQCDYAAANEVLNKLAMYLDRQWPGRVLSINWGPWAKKGMVSEGVKKQFAERGVQLISPQAGRHALVDELLYGPKGQVEVIIGDGPWERIESDEDSHYASLPLLNGTRVKNDGGVHVIEFTLDPHEDRYLRDHQLDGKPVFPTAMAMELMAETAHRVWPDLQITGIRSLQVLQGIILEKESRMIRVVARPHSKVNTEDPMRELQVEIFPDNKSQQASFRGIIQLSKQFSEPPTYNDTKLNSLQPFPLMVEEAYRQFLFHGPSFQGIRKINGINEQGISAILQPSSPAHLVSKPAGDHWLLDPVVIDSGFQLAILWERNQHEMTPLPARIKSYRRFGSLSGSTVCCYLHARTSAGGHVLLVDIYFVDHKGGVVSQVEEMEFSCSNALNRLAEVPSAGVEGR